MKNIRVGCDRDQPRSEVEDYGNCTNFHLKLLSVSAHTLPPMKLLCSTFILSLTGQQSSRNRSRNESFRDSDDDSARDDLSDLSDNEVSRPIKPAVTPTNEDEDTDELSAQLVNHDWSFLSTVLPDQDNVVH